MRVAVVGSRDYPNEDAVRRYVRRLPRGVIVVSGGARNVDTWAVDEAARTGKGVEVHAPDYGANGRIAPLVRNDEIARVCDRMVAFWDGESRGTAYVVRAALLRGKPVKVFGIEGEQRSARRCADTYGRHRRDA